MSLNFMWVFIVPFPNDAGFSQVTLKLIN
jgi:hypothetical protein